MSASNTTENDLALYVFDSTAPAWASNSDFYVRLHSSDPGEAGTATTNEVAYTSYDGVAEAVPYDRDFVTYEQMLALRQQLTQEYLRLKMLLDDEEVILALYAN